MIQPERKFMEAAIENALQAREKGDYAVGAVMVMGDEIIAYAGNRTRSLEVATYHAEMLVIEQTSLLLGRRHLPDCILYSTHEPCPMCTGGAIMARLKGIVAGARLQDMIDFAVSNGNDKWVWRTIDIPSPFIISKSKGKPLLFYVPDFMREECIKLFHS